MWVETRGHQIPGRIQQPANTPRSYIVETPSGELRRNRELERSLNLQLQILPLQKESFLNLPLFTRGQSLVHKPEQSYAPQIIYDIKQTCKGLRGGDVAYGQTLVYVVCISILYGVLVLEYIIVHVSNHAVCHREYRVEVVIK